MLITAYEQSTESTSAGYYADNLCVDLRQALDKIDRLETEIDDERQAHLKTEASANTYEARIRALEVELETMSNATTLPCNAPFPTEACQFAVLSERIRTLEDLLRRSLDMIAIPAPEYEAEVNRLLEDV